MTLATALSAAPTWEKAEWHGEPAWRSAQGAVAAIVSETRARLVYLGAADGSQNLLNAPVPHPQPTAQNPSPNQGGHRFWLGPQHRWVWPPLPEWEHAPAAGVSGDGPVLTVRMPHLNRDYPAIVREYAWEGARLRCTARWPDDGRPYFGLHVVPIDAPATISARLVKWDEVPAGLVVARMIDPEPPFQPPHPSVTLSDDRATLVSRVRRFKAGFAPQVLTVDRVGGWRLSVHPGPHEGVALGSADQGYLSQVWVGGPDDDLAELEQLSPYLRGDARGQCASTIYIEALPPPR